MSTSARLREQDMRAAKADQGIQRLVGEFWTSRQRQMHSLHYVISYRASFKPELPNYFITRFSAPGDIVMDPFLGRGTTVLEANLLGRVGWGNDVNPMAERITYAKTHPVNLHEVDDVLASLDLSTASPVEMPQEFAPFYHPKTFAELLKLREYLKSHRSDAARFVELLALARLHGHSDGFFSVYSFPQISVTPEAQERINRSAGRAPEYREVASRIRRKAIQSLKSGQLETIRRNSVKNRLAVSDVRSMDTFPSGKVQLIVTSPPFLSQVDYIQDNWLELWFLGIDRGPLAEKIVQTPDLDIWVEFMSAALEEMWRLLRPSGHCVIEVGEVKHGGAVVNLDEVIVNIIRRLNARPFGLDWEIREIMVNEQRFTKLAHCFGVTNNAGGTNTNRLVVMRRGR